MTAHQLAKLLLDGPNHEVAGAMLDSNFCLMEVTNVVQATYHAPSWAEEDAGAVRQVVIVELSSDTMNEDEDLKLDSPKL